MNSLEVIETSESTVVEISTESVIIEILGSGPKGDPGTQGVDGNDGPQGDVGPTGPAGVTVVTHGTDPNVARPVGAPIVYWVGPAYPVNALSYDWRADA